MKRDLITRIVLFNCIFLACGLALTIYYRLIIPGTNLDTIAQFQKRINQAQIVFFGDSFIQCAIDDRRDSAITNAANSAEMYFFTLEKIKITRPRVVVLGISYHSFQKYYDKQFNKLFFRYRSILTEAVTDQYISKLDNESKFLFHTLRMFPFVASKLKKPSDQWSGGFSDQGNQTNLSEYNLKYRISEVFPENRMEPRSKFQIDYVIEILEYCRQQGIPVIMLATPLYAPYAAMIPPAPRAQYDSLLETLRERYDFTYLDYTTWFSRPEDSAYFYDEEHLNRIGSALFTGMEVSRIRQLPLGRE